MIFILIMIMTDYRAGGLTSAEFANYESCYEAKIEFEKLEKGIHQNYTAICVPKDTKLIDN